MVCDVAGKYVSQCPHGEGIPAGHSAPHPGLGRQISEKGQTSQADRAELFDMTGPRKLVGLCSGSTNVLIVARQWAVEAAGKPECTGKEDPLAVVDVIEYLADAPLFGRVAIERFLVGDGRQEGKHFFQLSIEQAEDVVARDLVDVAEVVWRGFTRFWTSHHAIILSGALRGSNPAYYPIDKENCSFSTHPQSTRVCLVELKRKGEYSSTLA